MTTHDSFWTDLRGCEYSQGYLQAGDIRTRYLHAGNNSLPPLILLHGVGGHAETYTRNLQSHAEHFDTYSIDMVGHGYSSKPDYDYEVDAYVEHLRSVINTLGFDRIYLSGESLGGWVAARFALTYPQRLEWLMADPATVTDDLVACRQAIYQQPGMLEAMSRIMCLQETEIRQRNNLTDTEWSAIETETLVLWTDKDPTAAVTVGEKIANLIPNAKFALMTACGHWPQFEDPSTFNRIHLDFLRGLN
jgi:2-hydroxy-6-oxonona-2,4-dienedioate hydrolase